MHERSRLGKRTAARLAAVQALYEIDVAESDADAVLQSALSRGSQLTEDDSGRPSGELDVPHLRRVLGGVSDHIEKLDQDISACLSADLALERMEPLLRAILRSGAYELFALNDIPFKVVINEYVNITHAFYSGKGPTLVNGVLDCLAVRFGRSEPDSGPISGPTSGPFVGRA